MFSDKTMRSFWAKVDRKSDGECWPWLAGLARGGYGQFMTSRVDGSKWYRAHRFSFEAHNGPIPDGGVVMHSCDNPICVNPSHLSAGTQRGNMADRDAKGRGWWQSGDARQRATPWQRSLKMPVDVDYILDSKLDDRSLARELGVSPAHIWKIRNFKYAWVRAGRGLNETTAHFGSKPDQSSMDE